MVNGPKGFLGLALLLGLSLGHAPAPEQQEVFPETQARLFLADNGPTPQILALDLPRGEVVARIPVPPKTMSLGALPSGRYLLATRGRDTDRQWVSAILTGKEGEWRRPILVKSLLLGKGVGGFEGSRVGTLFGKPFLAVEREGFLLRFPEEALEWDKAFLAEKLALGAPDHYHFVQLGEDRLAVGYLRLGKVRLLDREGKVLSEAPCPVMHGEAITEQALYFACAKDLLVLDREGREVARLPYPVPERIGAFLEGEGVFFGYTEGSRHLQLLEPKTQRLTPIPLGGTLLRGKGYGEVLLVLLQEGHLQVRSGKDGLLLRSIRVDGGFPELEEDTSGAVLPDIARLDHLAYVSLPHRGLIAEVDWKKGKLLRYLRVGGMPTRLVLVR